MIYIPLQILPALEIVKHQLILQFFLMRLFMVEHRIHYGLKLLGEVKMIGVLLFSRPPMAGISSQDALNPLVQVTGMYG